MKCAVIIIRMKGFQRQGSSLRIGIGRLYCYFIDGRTATPCNMCKKRTSGPRIACTLPRTLETISSNPRANPNVKPAIFVRLCRCVSTILVAEVSDQLFVADAMYWKTRGTDSKPCNIRANRNGVAIGCSAKAYDPEQ